METEQFIESHIENLIKLGPWIKSVIVGAFLLGVWVTTLQLQVTYLSNRVISMELATKAREEKFDTWKDTIIQEMTEVKSEIRALREDISEIKDEWRSRNERK